MGDQVYFYWRYHFPACRRRPEQCELRRSGFERLLLVVFAQHVPPERRVVLGLRFERSLRGLLQSLLRLRRSRGSEQLTNFAGRCASFPKGDTPSHTPLLSGRLAVGRRHPSLHPSPTAGLPDNKGYKKQKENASHQGNSRTGKSPPPGGRPQRVTSLPRGYLPTLRQTEDPEQLRSRLNSFLGILSHYRSYRLRKEMFYGLRHVYRHGHYLQGMTKYVLNPGR